MNNTNGYSEYKNMHGGNHIVAESVMYEAAGNEGNAILHVKDVAGQRWTVAMPSHFTESFMVEAYQTLIKKKAKTEDDFQTFVKNFQRYFDTNASIEDLRGMFFDKETSFCVIGSDVPYLDAADDVILSSTDLT